MKARFHPEGLLPVLVTTSFGLMITLGSFDGLLFGLVFLAVAVGSTWPMSRHQRQGVHVPWQPVHVVLALLCVLQYAIAVWAVASSPRLGWDAGAGEDAIVLPVGIAVGCWVLTHLQPLWTRRKPVDTVQQS